MFEAIVYSLQFNAPDKRSEIEEMLRDEFYVLPGAIKLLLLANEPFQSTDIGVVRALEARLVQCGARPELAVPHEGLNEEDL